MTVAMTVDAEALPHQHEGPTSGVSVPSGGDDIQAYVAPAQARTTQSLPREGYSAATLVEMAGTVGIRSFSSEVFTNDSTCAVQWPYSVGVPMTYGFGMRNGRMHRGIDLVPGSGAHIQAIADGVVRASTDMGGDYGVMIIVDHKIDGQVVSSRYAHMESGSRQVQVGEAVRVGQFIGRTGDTGLSFGAHLHFEVLQNGTTAVDPLPWLRTNATC